MGLMHSTATATIANGQTVGPAFYVGAKEPESLRAASAITGVSVSFQGSHDNVTYQPIYSGGALYSEIVTTGKDTSLDGSILGAYPYLKLVSASAEGGDRSFSVFTRRRH